LRLSAGCTSFVIAHRLSTIRDADIIMAVKDGVIAESGSHEELIAKGGLYAQMYQSQFE
jgi:ATP-binding cassette subfamily B protein